MKTERILFRSLLLWFAILGAQNGAPFLAILTKDFAPTAVSRAGALSTYADDPLAIWYNPSIAPFINKQNKASVHLVHALLPQDVYMDALGVFAKTGQSQLFLSVSYFGSQVVAYNAAREKYGEMSSTTFLFQANTSVMPPKQNTVAFGANLKVLAGKSYVYDRIMVGLDASFTADLPKEKLRIYGGFRNLGADLSTFIKLNQYTNQFGVTNQDLRYQTPWPTSVGIGGRYSFMNVAEIFLDVDYYFPSPDVLASGGTILDGTAIPKLALSVIAIPDLKLNVGRVFRNAGGTSYFTFGAEFLIKIPNIPQLQLQYAFEPIPGFTDNHYFGLLFRIQ